MTDETTTAEQRADSEPKARLEALVKRRTNLAGKTHCAICTEDHPCPDCWFEMAYDYPASFDA